ncbi:PorT family protein [Hymenobacter sp. 15J16-1T3B]|uniref:outer membrane beta-barrel protein n=1 Tax=Hymenobacter sp. 15J16-1T3B TaxID=2886941 RepID=UPI001D12D742|nr:outer membrane beta-barrel protein [Hymenobacter sp. 15J16-1T3B]MCC3156584.1 PorT family protein [Hymenobacter sp. 15J16-1T3B]
MQHAYRLTALLLLSGAASLTAQAQTNFQPGYVLSLSGDTLRGSINFRDWDQNPKTVEFRPASGTSRTYHTGGIRGFGVAGEQYTSASVQVDASPHQVQNLPSSPAFYARQDSIFLRTLVAGPKSLYYYKDRNSKEHFFIRQREQFELLIYKQYLQAKSIVANKGYIGQLQLYLADCPTLAPRLRGAAYTQQSLTDVFSAYYTCVGQKPQAASQQRANPTHVYFGVVAGLSSTALHTEASDLPFSPNEVLDFERSVRPAGGLSADIVLPRNLKRLSLYTELLYSAFKAEKTLTQTSAPEAYVSNHITLNYSYLKLNVMMRYQFPLGPNGGLFANAGLGAGQAIKAEHSREVHQHYYSRDETTYFAAFGSEQKLEESVLAGVGGRYQRLSGELRFEGGTGMLNGIYQTSNTKRLYFLLGYRF